MEQTKLLRTAILALRVLQFASAAIVTGITAYFLAASHTTTWNLGRLIFTQLIAAMSLVIILANLLPSFDSFFQVPVDIAMSLLWWGVFGLLFNFTEYPCGWVFEWMNIAAPFEPQCARFSASTAFSFAAAVLFLLSGVLNVFVERRIGQQQGVGTKDERQTCHKREESPV
ncbi:hypothetical protein E4U42_001387 [Claviceps africana]|uniref:MARVEL domain-containing protein n=1 Tax=Claviceps africana TaxID=83212 RepID=A0A8K0IZX7_9HYPO|nr:hypothetical protein E4U42_001387 [Claviceps africana]